MPRISFPYGITIAMFWDERDHPIAHFHAEYGGQTASIAGVRRFSTCTGGLTDTRDPKPLAHRDPAGRLFLLKLPPKAHVRGALET